MNWRTVDMSRESRRDQFAYFQTLSNPYVGVTVQVDVTELAVWCRERGTSFFLAVLYAAVRAANGVPELRRRIRGDQVVEYDRCPSSHTCLLYTSLDDAHLVGDDHHGDPKLLVQVLQQGQDGGGGGGIQGGGGFVTQQGLGVRGQGPGDGHPLLLSAGELGGIGIRFLPQAHQVQQLQGPLSGLGGGGTAELHGEADVFQHLSLIHI